MAVTCKELIQKEHWDRFQNGDIVQFMDTNNSTYFGIVLRKSGNNIINLLMVGGPGDLKYGHYWFFHASAFQITKLFPVPQELISSLREGIELIYPHKYLDNLTYIEILARLREYERSI